MGEVPAAAARCRECAGDESEVVVVVVVVVVEEAVDVEEICDKRCDE
jgi:hypothetical protein